MIPVGQKMSLRKFSKNVLWFCFNSNKPFILGNLVLKFVFFFHKHTALRKITMKFYIDNQYAWLNSCQNALWMMEKNGWRGYVNLNIFFKYILLYNCCTLEIIYKLYTMIKRCSCFFQDKENMQKEANHSKSISSWCQFKLIPLFFY